MEKFEEVLAQYEPMISAVIRKLHIYRDFEQYRQAGRVALWQAWNRFDEDKGNFTPFAYRSIYGALLDEMKRENRFSSVNSPMEGDVLEGMGSYSFEVEDDSGLGEAIRALTLEERRLLIHLFADHYSQAECAAVFDISVAGIKKRRERLLRKLREQLMATQEE
ncbi:sigma-70 family RNA polymerase sigma factor [Sporosarcina obsidiansis]|uniref:sigma-70 family RNA polymerase sigma factor n=1 Tax=Sporosarcina obsidiansis TaxID=2660748 RepID=UPI00129A0BCE|nr:sigma-70 family RNA polymerase sigma factor [Sporosarcina obsidiansis]